MMEIIQTSTNLNPRLSLEIIIILENRILKILYEVDQRLIPPTFP
jgi:hypothetical protein